MLLQEPPESNYDIRFNFLGFAVRVTWTFWVGTAVLGFSLVDGIDRYLNIESPGRLLLFVMWAGCVLVSILIHELGHALAFRQFGINSRIVLYHFGGLAVPTSSFSPGRGFGRLTEKQDLWIAAAGPLAQLVSAVLAIAALKAKGYQVFAFVMMPDALSRIGNMLDGASLELDNAALFALAVFYIWPSVMWALLNLLPVWPLDGGRITRSTMLIHGGNAEQAMWISLIVAGGISAYGFMHRDMFLGILFASLALGNYQMLQGGGMRY